MASPLTAKNTAGIGRPGALGGTTVSAPSCPDPLIGISPNWGNRYVIRELYNHLTKRQQESRGH